MYAHIPPVASKPCTRSRHHRWLELDGVGLDDADVLEAGYERKGDRVVRQRPYDAAQSVVEPRMDDRWSQFAHGRWGKAARSQWYTWVVSTDELLAEVFRLPRQDRVRVAEELFFSLEEPDEDVAAAWAGELERRSRDLAAGRVRTVPWETVRARIMNELEQRRAGRASS